MNLSTLLAVLVVLAGLAYVLGRQRSVQLASAQGGVRTLNSLPFYYGALTAIWCAVPSLLIFLTWIAFDDAIIRSVVIAGLPEQYQNLSPAQQGLLLNQLQNIAGGAFFGDVEPALQQAAERLSRLQEISRWSLAALAISLGCASSIIAWLRVSPHLKARVQVERAFRLGLLLCSLIAIATTAGIVLSVLFESLRFFRAVPFTEFVFGLEWSPQTAIRADQVGSSGSFGAVPLFVGTLLISAIAMLVAVPVGLMAAIYLAEYSSRRVRDLVKPALEILAGIPTVVYGFFAALTVAPFIRDLGAALGLDASSESALAAGLVMGVMIIPFISSLADDVISAVPQSLRDGALALGATRSETIKQVVVPAALPGIVGGVLLAVSRAIGETMIVVMAAGLAANLTANPLETVTTVTVQIVTLLVGDQEFNSPKTLSAFALGLMLFAVTLCLNFLALHVVKKYREHYE
ncbi:phosphate ABC transporter permease subunit PstC [Gilvimarinus sp. F26214L]|uniref:phosphate ABC transporter permease subunit PstC n=1 Tax=Gilvimarinus sp. DZF01 TaxID=3461371 RepID=UPI004045DE08